MRIVSNDTRTKNYSLITIVLGGAMIAVLNRSSVPSPAHHWAYIGCLFLVTIGSYVLILSERISIRTDPEKRTLKVRRKNAFGQKTETIPYEEVVSVHVVRIGRKTALKTYHLIIRLTKERKLTPGRWSRNPLEINDVANELAREIECEVIEAPIYGLPDIRSALLAGPGALLIYVLWYRMTVGETCLAMWFGTAPAMIIPSGFISLLYLFRRRIN